MKRKSTTAALAAVLAIGAVTATAGSASAYIVCNRYNECWHVHNRVHYARALRPVWHSDDWYFHRNWDQDKSYQWRQYHEGRGRWENGTWIDRERD